MPNDINPINIIKDLTLTKSVEHKAGKSLKVALEYINGLIAASAIRNNDTSPGYRKMFLYFDFDTFAQLKELYSSKIYKFIPEWKEYFAFNNLSVCIIKKNPDPIRLYFINLKSAKSSRDGSVRAPYYININDIDYAGYYKLLKYLILLHYSPDDRFNASKLRLLGQRAAFETNASYIMHDGRILKSIEQCIKTDNEEGLRYLIEELGIKPTWHQLNKIEVSFGEYLSDLAAYYFE